MNNLSIVGNIGKDNELNKLPDGKSVLNNSIAVRRSYKNRQGEYETDWFNISLFGKQADNFAQYTQKGSKVGIVGRLEFRQYQNNQGQNVTTHEVKVNDFYLLESKNNQNQQSNNQYQNNQSPFNEQSNYNQPSQNQYGRPDHEMLEAKQTDELNISQENLPF